MVTSAKLDTTSCRTLKFSGQPWLLGDWGKISGIVLVLYFRGITTGQGMCDLMLQEAKVIKATRNQRHKTAKAVKGSKKFKLHRWL